MTTSFSVLSSSLTIASGILIPGSFSIFVRRAMRASSDLRSSLVRVFPVSFAISKAKLNLTGRLSPYCQRSSDKNISSGVPSNTALPLLTMMTLSHLKASVISWVMVISVRPFSSRIFSTRARKSSLLVGSSIAVASSRISMSGRIARAPAIASFCFCPPDNAVVSLFLYSYNPTSLRAWSTRSLNSGLGTPRFSGPKATSSSIMVPTIWLSGFWKTQQQWDLMSQNSSSSPASFPKMTTLPLSGTSRISIIFASVDLPEPLLPKIAV